VGHDFRPDYLRLGDVVARLGHPPVAALTATASPPVRAEIAARLELTDPVEVVRGFDRPNLDLRVVRHTDGVAKRRAVVDDVVAGPRPALVYVARRKAAERYAEALRGRGVVAAAYHAGLPAGERERVHRDFLGGRLDVVVAASAFGMGIDKPDVRAVVHADPPGSIDAYYQEIGRAGRDGLPATAVLHYRPEDLGLRRFFSAARAAVDDVAALLAALRARPGPAAEAELRVPGLTSRRLTRALQALLDVGAARRIDGGVVAVGRRAVADVTTAVRERAAARQRVELTRVEMMRGYAEVTTCRRAFLLGYFGEHHPGGCGGCDVCRRGADLVGAATAPGRAPSVAFAPHDRVVHARWGEGTVLRVEEDRVTVFFPDQGYRTLDIDVVAERGLLREPPEDG
jgi:ATP-dependent DNA helicase RecQ